jgi:hypothetical protein
MRKMGVVHFDLETDALPIDPNLRKLWRAPLAEAWALT